MAQCFEAAVDGLGRAVGGPVREVGEYVVAAPVQGPPEGQGLGKVVVSGR